ncbi:hypothetical protein K437DRAFT_14474 [Tilletiaria anomala UBC 951]|uniref:Transcription factor Iwr1 domain-containing protein n=1 Tax=Tilletiaria anomala (strain ATCC 24038 / CBS 436.72 / UBC 951) TaxID=1037660 RepID=A0A066VFU2_TILAU|nr:uncharacterized protein K437DRAFT_14474 [Tilletiaria anomala UBC 951]KDN39173.1 hypothetical protein K437DRAFT_14474 [Tilletiaria anomala UBC 951]
MSAPAPAVDTFADSGDVAANQRQAASGSTSSGAPAGPVSMILRIKRKRGTEPADALYIEGQLRGAHDELDDGHHLKRRSSVRLPASPSLERLPSTPQAPDSNRASPFDVSASKQQQTPGYFRFAETMATTSKADELELRKRVTKLQMMRRNAQQRPASATPTPSEGSDSYQSQSDSGELAALRRYKAVVRAKDISITKSMSAPASGSATAAAAGGSYHRRSALLKRSGSDASLRRKAAVIGDIRQASEGRGKREIVPGAATAAAWISQSRAKSKRQQARIIDIVVQEEKAAQDAARQSKAAKSKRKEKKKQADPVDSLGDVFKNMLVDHLRAKNAEVPNDLRDDDLSSEMPSEAESDDQEDDDDDYVYDIYYREIPAAMPSRASANGAAEVGLRPSHVAGSGYLQPNEEEVNDQAAPAGSPAAVAAADAAASASSTAGPKGSTVFPTSRPPLPLLGIQGVQSIAALNVSSLSRADWEELMMLPSTKLDGVGGVYADEDDEDGDLEELVDEEMVGSKLGLGAKPGDGFDSWDEGEDEDSNDEDFYRNDYPEQEISDDDEFGLGHEYRRDSDDGDDW